MCVKMPFPGCNFTSCSVFAEKIHHRSDQDKAFNEEKSLNKLQKKEQLCNHDKLVKKASFL